MNNSLHLILFSCLSKIEKKHNYLKFGDYTPHLGGLFFSVTTGNNKNDLDIDFNQLQQSLDEEGLHLTKKISQRYHLTYADHNYCHPRRVPNQNIKEKIWRIFWRQCLEYDTESIITILKNLKLNRVLFNQHTWSFLNSQGQRVECLKNKGTTLSPINIEQVLQDIWAQNDNRWPLLYRNPMFQIICLDPSYREYAQNYLKILNQKNLFGQVKSPQQSLRESIKKAHEQAIEIIFIIGKEEINNNFITVRIQNKVLRPKSDEDFFMWLDETYNDMIFPCQNQKY